MPSTTGASNSASATLQLFTMTTSGKLSKVEDTSGEKETKMYMVDDAEHRVEQVYLCQDRNDQGDRVCAGEWKVSELTKRARMVGDEQIVLTTAEIEDLKGSKLQKELLDLAIHDAEAFQAQTWVGAACYWFEPDQPNKAYTLLCQIVANPAKAVCGVMNLRGTDKMYRLLPFEGGIVLQEQLRPQSMHHFAAVHVMVSDKELQMMQTLVEAVTEPFDPAAYDSDRVASLRALIASKTPGGTITPIGKGKKPAPVEDDMEQLLAASLALAIAKKAAAS